MQDSSKQRLSCVSVSPSGRYMALGGDDETVKVMARFENIVATLRLTAARMDTKFRYVDTLDTHDDSPEQQPRETELREYMCPLEFTVRNCAILFLIAPHLLFPLPEHRLNGMVRQ